MIQAIKAGQLIDGLGGEPLQDAVLLFEGQTILAVGPMDQTPIPSGSQVIDASDRTVMPGLIDVHTHVMMTTASMENELFTPKAVAYFLAAENLKRTLGAGFTTVRDAGGADAGLRQAIEMGLIAGPRLVVSGMIGQTGGLMERRFPSGAQIMDENSWRVCDGVEDVRKTMRKVLRQGVDFVKIFTTGGVVAPQGSPFIAEWSPSELAVIVEEAQRADVGVMAHAEGLQGVKNALRAGVKSIEHGNVLDDEAIQLFLDNSAYLTPTLHISKILAERMDSAGLSEASKLKEARLVAESQGCFRCACQAGVKVTLGTDAFIADMHGTNAVELELMMQEGGLSAMQAIVAGTLHAAESCRLGDQSGSLQPGRLADILLVAGDPLSDIRVLQDTSRITVIKQGTLVE